MCDEGIIASLLLEITKKLTDNNVSFSINMRTSTSVPQALKRFRTLQPFQRRQNRSLHPTQKARNLKRLLEHKEKMQKKLESTTSSEDSLSAKKLREVQ